MRSDSVSSLSLSSWKHLSPRQVYSLVEVCDQTLFQPAVVIDLHRWLYPKELTDLYERLSGLEERWAILRVEVPYWVRNEPVSAVSVQHRPNTLVVFFRDEDTPEKDLFSVIEGILDPTVETLPYVRISRVEGYDYTGTIVHGVVSPASVLVEILEDERLFLGLLSIARVLKAPVRFEILERALFEAHRMPDFPVKPNPSPWIVRAGMVANPGLDLYRNMNLDDIPYRETRHAVDHLEPRTASLASAGLNRAFEESWAGTGMAMKVERLQRGFMDGDRLEING